MTNLFRAPSDSAAKAAERQTALQRAEAARQHEETMRQSERAAAEAAQRAAEQEQRAKAAETLQANLQRLAQEQMQMTPEVVTGGSAEQFSTDDRKRKRKMPTLSTSLGLNL